MAVSFALYLLTVDGHLGCFQFSAITNKAAMNVHVKAFVFYMHMFSFFSGRYLRMEWLEPMVGVRASL